MNINNSLKEFFNLQSYRKPPFDYVCFYLLRQLIQMNYIYR